MHKNIIFLILFSILAQGYAQKEAAFWYFGQNAGVDFNDGIPKPLYNGKITTGGAIASISNGKGDLLFYTDGITVWDKNHSIMPNGEGLKGGRYISANTHSAASCLIIPLPGSKEVYYIFTNDYSEKGNGLQYHIVNMTLNGGLGDVISKDMYIAKAHENLTTVFHDNGQDIWVITHKKNVDTFFAYLLNQNGLITKPVTTQIPIKPLKQLVGKLKASTNGKFLALAGHDDDIFSQNILAELFSFDSATGKVSNPIDLSTVIASNTPGVVVTSSARLTSLVDGVEFSVDSSKLYISSNFYGGRSSNFSLDKEFSFIFQFNLDSNNIEQSIFPVVKSKVGVPGYKDLQLAIDGKIYVARQHHNFLSVIDNPNVSGAACNFINEGVNLSPKICNGWLPGFFQSFFKTGIKAKGLCFRDETEFSLYINEPLKSIKWDFGDGHTSTKVAPSHIYANPGKYIVKAKITSGFRTKTETKEVIIYDTPVANPVTDYNICIEEDTYRFDLSTKDSEILGGQSVAEYGVKYYSNIDDARVDINELPILYTINEPEQKVYAKVFNINNTQCYDITSFKLSANVFDLEDLKKTGYLCVNNTEVTRDGGDFEGWQWKDSHGIVKGTSRFITITEPDTYSLTVSKTKNNHTCSKTIMFEVKQVDSPTSLDTDVSGFSNLITLTLKTSHIGDFEYSIDGEHFKTDNTFKVPPGEYTVYARDKFKCHTLRKDVVALGYNQFFTPNGDGINERWHIKGLSKYPKSVVYIYNRHGKLIKQLSLNSLGWDGNFNGSPLPDEDYWFRYVYEEGKAYIGHFTLKR
ncbi:T9SS type B sorting domain-containing protein [Flavivirga abyssicola]|uniref:T9SS type B sorting domain-containing protein n=1 Tax=Flavivirga abyssicola TaxID=3063533 RepID=UPI0026DEB849|nr:T9SS type B sorting domain-containing protein [Flavivirga sp. MEBiC07777]WVK13114.1 T9SS type B sorting domain-containing protein [Flavivirga sp. MEBiC07777]